MIVGPVLVTRISAAATPPLAGLPPDDPRHELRRRIDELNAALLDALVASPVGRVARWLDDTLEWWNGRGATIYGEGYRMGWYENQKARHEAAKGAPSLTEKVTAKYQDSGGDRAREGEVWTLAGTPVVIAKTVGWSANQAHRTKVKVKPLGARKAVEVLATQLERSEP